MSFASFNRSLALSAKSSAKVLLFSQSTKYFRIFFAIKHNFLCKSLIINCGIFNKIIEYLAYNSEWCELNKYIDKIGIVSRYIHYQNYRLLECITKIIHLIHFSLYSMYKERARARMRELGVPSVFLRSSFGDDSVKVQSDNGVVSEW